MQPFALTHARTVADAAARASRGGRLIAGGTTLVDLMREEVESPTALIDISSLSLRDITATPGGGLRIGALSTMAQTAEDPKVRRLFPVISEALELSASAQLRNMATIGGNLMQRTRCTYFRDPDAACNKREPGSGCSALAGYNRTHAILGGSKDCVATHSSDLAVALVALGAVVRLRGPRSARTVALSDFLLPPGDTPAREHDLQDGELITAVDVPAVARPLRSGYLKVRDRQSYEFALCSAAVGLHLTGGVVRGAYVAAGGVGTVPWRLPAVEKELIGQRPGEALWARAAARAAEGARPLQHNRFKVELLRRTLERQLATIGGTS